VTRHARRAAKLAAVLAVLAGCSGEDPQAVQYAITGEGDTALSCPGADHDFRFLRCEDEHGNLEDPCITPWARCRWHCASYCGLEPGHVLLWFVKGAAGWRLAYETVYPYCDGGSPAIGAPDALDFTCGA
jgi:hypothetical protein